MKSVTLQVSDGLYEAGDIVLTLCADIRAKKTLAQDASDVFPKLLSAAGDLKSINIQSASERAYLAVILEEVVEVFVAAAPSAPVAVAAPAQA
jgi:hypothetical protein